MQIHYLNPCQNLNQKSETFHMVCAWDKLGLLSWTLYN